jgi:threonine dehydratase
MAVHENMRWVPVPQVEHDMPEPTPEQLELARDLPAAFPDAGLREVSLLRATALDRIADPSESTRIWLAVEAMQVTGSFKVRGALAAIARREAATPLVTASAGHHGVGMAYAGRVQDRSVTIVVTNRAPLIKLERMRSYGAELLSVDSEHYADAEEHGKAIARSRGSDFVSANDLDVVVGNGGSIGFELARALGGVPDLVIAPVGGGGLATGMGWALRSETESARASVIGVQHEAFAALAALIEGTSGVRATDCAALARAASQIAAVATASSDEVGHAVAHAHAKLGLSLESAAALPLVPVLAGLPRECCGGDVVLVLTARAVEVDRGRLTAAWR